MMECISSKRMMAGVAVAALCVVIVAAETVFYGHSAVVAQSLYF